MEPLDLDGLAELARAATPGPWAYNPDFPDEVGAGDFGFDVLAKFAGPENAEYAAAADPSTVLRLVEMARLGEAVDGETLRAAIDKACSLTNPRLSEVDWDDVAAALAADNPARKPER